MTDYQWWETYLPVTRKWLFDYGAIFILIPLVFAAICIAIGMLIA